MRISRWAGVVGALAGWWSVLAASAGEEIPRAEHPRPDFCRQAWLNLNGTWDFCFDPEDRGLGENWQSDPNRFDRQIVVPFGWQSQRSNVADTSGQQIGWYRRTVKVPENFRGRHIWLRFEAVDWEARVWVNGREAGRHEGGYSPFGFDVAELVQPGREMTVVVRARDATDSQQPCGKQGHRWYTPTSGIWQTVWLEARPAQYVDQIRLTPVARGPQWSLEAAVEAAGLDGQAKVEIVSPDANVAKYEAPLELKGGRGGLSATLKVESPRLWTPDDPHLYDLEIRLTGADGAADVVSTYFGLRTIARGKYGELPYELILLNGVPIYLRGALDQSFNPEGIYTAPSDEFLRRDLEIAKAAGFNFLRIHIKAEEPRRLYWADRLGVLVMEDMPCTWEQSAKARQAWAETMRATIARDRNHPSIIAWCLFNESWGLGGDGFKSDADTQQWVEQMFQEAKQKLDPSRLVEDNSPCRFDHVKTDLNSWHFYIDDYWLAREHLEKVVANTHQGSTFNYVAGRSQDTAPLVNSEYGAVSARSGDRDISWGFRYLTTQLRRHERIQGYVYTELTDVEWEHNGVVNYDRSAKEFGYDEFVSGMTLADLQGADFVGFDAPPALEINPGAELTVPVFVSHFSQRTGEPTLQWQIMGTDHWGKSVTTEVQTAPVVWQPYRATAQKPIRGRVPQRRIFVGALAVELLDEEGKRIAANFVNLIVRRPNREDEATEPPAEQPPGRFATEGPPVEILGPRLVAVRFHPAALASFRADAPHWGWWEDRGKFYGFGACEMEYHLALPEFVRAAGPAQMVLVAELAAKADTERLDWPAVRSPLDYPQTQQRKYPSKVSVSLSGQELWQVELPDDPADARGVLSHEMGYHRGSYGLLIRKKAEMTDAASLREALRSQSILPLIFRTTGGAHGLSIYGSRLGRYPIDPTLILQTTYDVKPPPGWSSLDPVVTHCLLDRVRVVEAIPTADSGGHPWRMATETPPADWAAPGFDDSSWQTGRGGFGTTAGAAAKIETPWTTSEIWLRSDVELPSPPAAMALRHLHQGDLEIYVNGKLVVRTAGEVRDYRELPLTKVDMDRFQQGPNTIAVHGRRTDQGQAVDVGLQWVEIQAEPSDAPEGL